jgi:hypothetical protein
MWLLTLLVPVHCVRVFVCCACVRQVWRRLSETSEGIATLLIATASDGQCGWQLSTYSTSSQQPRYPVYITQGRPTLYNLYNHVKR